MELLISKPEPNDRDDSLYLLIEIPFMYSFNVIASWHVQQKMHWLSEE